ncbi:MAG: hypothetical protein ACRBEQ_00085 [Hyphomonas sp.]
MQQTHLKNLSGVVCYGLLITVLTFIFVNVIVTQNGATKIKAPLFIVVFCNLVFAWFVSLLAVELSKEESSEDEATERGRSVYVFTNAISGLTGLAAHFAEVLSTKALSTQNALAFVISHSISQNTDAFLKFYLFAVLVFLLVSIGFAIVGVKLIVSSGISFSAVKTPVQMTSGILLALSISVVTPWNDLPMSTGTVSTLWGVAGVLSFFFLFAILFGLFSFAIIRNIVSLSVQGIATRSHWLGVPLSRQIIFEIITQIATGAIKALGILCLLYLSIRLFTHLSFGLPSDHVSTQVVYEVEQLIDSRLISALLWTLKFATVSSLIGAAIIFRKPIWEILKKIRDIRFSKFTLLNKKWSFPIIPSTRAYLRHTRFKFLTTLSKFKALPIKLAKPCLSLNYSLFRYLILTTILAAIPWIGLMPTPSIPFTLPDSDPVIEVETSDTEAEREEPTKIDPAEIYFTSLPICPNSTRNMGWQYGSHEKFEIVVSDCFIEHRGSSELKAILFVGISSLGKDVKNEEDRALERATTLANIPVLGTEFDTPKFILFLGMAKSKYTTGNIGLRNQNESERPALAYGIESYPENSSVTGADLSKFLDERLSRSSTQTDFTQCKLFEVKSFAEHKLQEIEGFHCGRSKRP